MQLHPFELYSLIELLDPTLFPSYEDFDDHRKELAGLNQKKFLLALGQRIRTVEEEKEADAPDGPLEGQSIPESDESLRKFLKMVGVSSQNEIEKAVARALAEKAVAGNEVLPATYG